MPAPQIKVGPLAYDRWRAASLGGLTEDMERALLWDLAGEPDGLLLLDVGCGDGGFTRQAVKRGAKAVGLDPDPAMLAAAQGQAANGAASPWWVRGLAQQLPVREASCDLVVAVTVLCFLTDSAAQAALSEMARVLKPGGRLVLGELSPWSLWAAHRRIRGWLGASLWRAARFHGPNHLRCLAAEAGLTVQALRGAIDYPPWWRVARLMAPWDRAFSRLTNVGAAFLVLQAAKPLSNSGS